MNQDKLNEYKLKLESERKAVLREIQEDEKPKDFGTETVDPDESTDEAEELGNQLASLDSLKGRLSEIDIALEKIRTGGYGICEECKKPIEEEILDIDPESRFCKATKLAMEAKSE